MEQNFFELSIQTPGKGLVDITDLIGLEVTSRSYETGLLTLWCTHTGASLLVQATSEDHVADDILAFFENLVPQDPDRYLHKRAEHDNAPSHLRALLTQTQISLPISDAVLPLGKVQRLLMFEHRVAPKSRRLTGHFIGTMRAK